MSSLEQGNDGFFGILNQNKKIIDETIRKEQMAKIKEKYQGKQQDAIDTYLQNQQEYGDDHFITQISKICCELISRMDVTLNTLVQMQESISIIDSVFNLMDSSMSGMDEIMKSGNEQTAKYSFANRRKIKKMQRNYVNGITNRFKAISDKLVMFQMVSETLAKEMTKMSKNMLNRSSKFSAILNGAAGRKSKKGGTAAPEFSDEKLMKMVEQRRQERAKGNGGVGTAVASEGVAAGSAGTDINDIL